MKKSISIPVVIVLMLVLLIGQAGIVAAAGNDSTMWNVPGDFASIQDAIDSELVADGDTILVGAGNQAGALVTKSVNIKGEEGAIINNGPPHPAGLCQGFRLLEGSDGSSISHLQFEVDLAIMNGAAVDDIAIEHNTFIDTIQAISNWRGNGWVISHNEITDLRTRNGGGIGILVADYAGGEVKDNLVFQNTITGRLHVWSGDGGGYDGSGIVIYADYRWGRAGATEISNNRIVKNKVSLSSDTPSVVDVNAFELTDTRDSTAASPYPVIFDNSIGFNDFRGTVKQILLTPMELGDHNDISRNLGENRGHGLHPGALGPGQSWNSYYDGSTAEVTELSGDDSGTKIKDGILTYSVGHFLEGQPLQLGYDPYGYNYQAHMFNGSYANAYLGRDGYPAYTGDDDSYLAENPGAESHWTWPYRTVSLMMTWNDAWLSNMDRDGDGVLDRHYGYDGYIGSGAWLTNHQSGTDVEDGQTYTWNYFVKIVASPADAAAGGGIWYAADGTEIGPVIWGYFAIIQEVINDTGTGEHGISYLSPARAGLGNW